MKVLHIIPSLSQEWGGPVSVVSGLLPALRRAGVDVSIFASFQKGKKDKIIPLEGVNIKLFKQDFFSKICTAHSSGFMKTLYNEIANFDIVHVHGVWHYPNFATCLVAKKTQKPYVVTIHGVLAPWSLRWKFFKKRIYSILFLKHILGKATAIQAITEVEVDYIKRFVNNKRITVIPNGIDIQKFKKLPSVQEIEKRYPTLVQKRVILFLGRIHHGKGLDILAQALSKIIKSDDNIFLLIVGPDEGGYKVKAESIFKKENILNKVLFTGMLTGKEKLAVLSRADLFVLPSYSEGFSVTVLEAMACKLPVIITNRCNFPEVARVKAGRIVEPDVGQLSKAIFELINNPELCQKMGENGERLIIEKYTWDKIANQMICLYKKALNNL